MGFLQSLRPHHTKPERVETGSVWFYLTLGKPSAVITLHARRFYIHRSDHQERCDGLPLLTYPQADQEGANVQRTPSQLNRALLKTGQDIYGADLTSRRVLLAVIGAEQATP